MLAYPSMGQDQTLMNEGLKMASMRAEAKDAAMYTFESPMTKRINDRVGDHQMKLQEHRQKLDQHKMYLMHIASEADIVEQQEDSSTVPTINNKSRSLVGERPDRVENILLAKGMEYEIDIEHKRMEQEARMEKDTTFQPTICKQSKDMANSSEMVFDRLQNWGEQQRDRKAQNQQQAADHKEKSSTMESESRVALVLGEAKKGKRAEQFIPVITERSQRKQREYHDCLTWGEEQKKKQEELREKYDELELAEVRPAPIISDRSRKLAEKQDREGKIEDTLLAWKDKKKELQENKTAEEADERCPYQPQITQYAANLEREGDVGSRLYNKAFEYRAKRQEEIERQMLEIEQMAKGGHSSPRRHGSYAYEHNVEAEPRTLPIELDLHRREMERQQYRDQLMQEQHQEEANMHYPRINAMSDLIAEKLPENSVQRLLKPKVVWEAPEDDEDPDLTFKPKVNPRSIEINNEKLARGEVSADRNEYLYQKDEENKYRMEQARKRALDKEMEECTFQPNINRNSQSMPSSSHSVVARTQQWQKQRNARMRAEREAQEKKEMENCTFRPTIRDYKPKKEKNKKKQDNYGVDQHLERQVSARNQRKEETVPHSTGEGWSNTLTKPQEFSFNHKVKIKALAKPIGATEAQAKIEQKKDDLYLQGPSSYVYGGRSESMMSSGSASAEWMRRAAEKEQSEQAHAAAGMMSPRYYASDALNVHTGTPRGRTGEDTHVTRMKQARAEKELKERSAKSTTGENWRGGTTKPREFKFADSKALRVRALHKPVSPMLS